MPACHVRPHVYAPRAAAHAALAIGALLGLCAHAAASTHPFYWAAFVAAGDWR